MIKGRTLSATTLRLILAIALFGIAVIAGVAIDFIIKNGLRPFAVDVSHVVIDASASQNNIQNLQKIQKELADQKDAIDRASSIVAESRSYEYQDQIITDLNDYATKAGISITNIDFSAVAATTQPTASPTTTPKAPTTSAPTGVKTLPISVTIKNPVVYDNLLHFIKSVEQNLTKMQISKISLAKGTGGDISSEVLTVEVYVR